MRSPDKVLVSLCNKSKDTSYKYEKIYRNLYNRNFYLVAYNKLYPKQGNMTPGSDGETIDGFNLDKIEKLIESIKNESYQPKPSRREYIPKKNGKKRPLGIPSFYDKLVQEVVRQILEAIYENSFSTHSHGFRPNRSCHTALKEIKINFTGTRWWIEGDIKGFFDNINHNVMINILRKRIKDEKFINLIWKFMRAGYIEDFRHNKTYSGTPQGGIISPILSNIYLNEFDQYIAKYMTKFNKGEKRSTNYKYKTIADRIYARRKILTVPNEKEKMELEEDLNKLLKERKEYQKEQHALGITNLSKDAKNRNFEKKIYKIRRKLKIVQPDERAKIIGEIKLIQQELRNHKTYEQMDSKYRRLRYVRYADDFLIGIIGSKDDAIKVKADLTEYLENELMIELSQEKTLITHNSNAVRFLGYELFIDEGYLRKRLFPSGKEEVARTGVSSIRLTLPHDILRDFMLKNGYITIDKKGNWKPCHRAKFIHNDPLEILLAYNAEFRGFYNYYKFAYNGRYKLVNAHFLFKQSFAKTLGAKYKSKTNKLRFSETKRGTKKFFREGKWGVAWTDKKGNERWITLFDVLDTPSHKEVWKNEEYVITNYDYAPIVNYGGRNGILARLKANKCEFCGDEKGPFEIHHVRKLKDLKGKQAWEKIMIARRRKTLVLCGNGSTNNCHYKLHNNKL